jgi:hypothetical protein
MFSTYICAHALEETSKHPRYGRSPLPVCRHVSKTNALRGSSDRPWVGRSSSIILDHARAKSLGNGKDGGRLSRLPSALGQWPEGRHKRPAAQAARLISPSSALALAHFSQLLPTSRVPRRQKSTVHCPAFLIFDNTYPNRTPSPLLVSFVEHTHKLFATQILRGRPLYSHWRAVLRT